MPIVKLLLGNSYSKIDGLTAPQFNKLRKLLSYSIDSQAAYFSGNTFNTTRYCIDKRGEFPSGLLPRVKQFLAKENIQYLTTDSRVQPKAQKPQKLKGQVKPYDWQLEACDKAIKAHRGIISASTGSGKSLVIALIAARLNVRTLVIVPSLEIKNQLQGSLDALIDTSNIIIENIDSNRIKTLKGIECLIIDEAHHAAAKTYRLLNKSSWGGTFYRFFLTATPFRNVKEETILFEGIAGSVVYSLSYQRSVQLDLIVPVEAYYIELPKIGVSGTTWAQVYKELVTHNTYRNEIIAKLMLDLEAADKATLCLVKEIIHGKKIQAMGPQHLAVGEDRESRILISAFNLQRIKTLTGTSGLLGEGVDTKPAEYVIIAGLGKAKSAFMQQIGRAVRRYKDKESAKIIIFKDPSHKFTARHFKAQCLILKEEYGITPIKLEID